MKFSNVTHYPITDTFEVKGPQGEVLESGRVTFDANKINGALLRKRAEIYAERVEQIEASFEVRAALNGKPKGKKQAEGWKGIAEGVVKRAEGSALTADLNKEVLAFSLASDRWGILMAWDMEDDSGKPMPPTFDTLMEMPEAFLSDLYEWCRETANPASVDKKKTGRKGRMTTSTSSSSEAEKSTTQQLDGPPN